jgi:hypothetical protein
MKPDMGRDMGGARNSTHLADPANARFAATAAGLRRLKGWLHTSLRSPDAMQHPGAASLIRGPVITGADGLRFCRRTKPSLDALRRGTTAMTAEMILLLMSALKISVRHSYGAGVRVAETSDRPK